MMLAGEHDVPGTGLRKEIRPEVRVEQLDKKRLKELIAIVDEWAAAAESEPWSRIAERICNRSLSGRATPAQSSAGNSDMAMMGGSKNAPSYPAVRPDHRGIATIRCS